MNSVRSVKPLVSIIITAHNYAQYLAECIESALGQGEIIVVDDGSTDSTREICERYPVKYIYQENQGLPSARNTGIKAAKGEWITCLDADDMLYPTFVEECLQKIGDVGIIRTGLKHMGDMDIEMLPPKDPQPEDWERNNQAYGTSMFPRKVWEKVGGYDERLTSGMEDWQLWLKIIRKGYKIATVEKPLFYYRKHGQSMVSGTDSNRAEVYKQMMSTL